MNVLCSSFDLRSIVRSMWEGEGMGKDHWAHMDHSLYTVLCNELRMISS